MLWSTTLWRTDRIQMRRIRSSEIITNMYPNAHLASTMVITTPPNDNLTFVIRIASEPSLHAKKNISDHLIRKLDVTLQTKPLHRYVPVSHQIISIHTASNLCICIVDTTRMGRTDTHSFRTRKYDANSRQSIPMVLCSNQS